jgi:hypothetical protein
MLDRTSQLKRITWIPKITATRTCQSITSIAWRRAEVNARWDLTSPSSLGVAIRCDVPSDISFVFLASQILSNARW